MADAFEKLGEVLLCGGDYACEMCVIFLWRWFFARIAWKLDFSFSFFRYGIVFWRQRYAVRFSLLVTCVESLLISALAALAAHDLRAHCFLAAPCRVICALSWDGQLPYEYTAVNKDVPTEQLPLGQRDVCCKFIKLCSCC